MELDELKEELKKYIKGDKRYAHSIGVMKMSQKLAAKYGADEVRAMKAGLMHDMAKEMTEEESLKYIEENNIEITEVEKLKPSLLHGKIAADIVKKKYGFDEDMCSAIKWHTTGRKNMTIMEKIVFCADKIDETRTYENVENYREIALKDLDQAILELLDHTITKNIKQRKILSEKSIETRNYILINQKK